MAGDRPIRVLHIIGGLGGGGSERLLWDIVRLSDPDRVIHRVATVYPDDGWFVYGDRLEKTGAYGPVTGDPERRARRGPLRRLLRRLYLRLPPHWQGKVFPLWQIVTVFPQGLLRVHRELTAFRPDVIHGHTFHGFSYGILARSLARRPLVYTMPCLFSQMVDAGHAWMPGVYRRFRHAVDYYATGASISELTEMGVPRDLILHLRGVVDLDTVDRVRSASHGHRREMRNQLSLPQDSIIALSVGRLDPSKGHQHAVDALHLLVQQVPRLHLLVLGEGSQRASLESQALSLGVEGHIHFLGFVQDPLPYYAAADLYLRTPVFEAENLSSYQAMAFGLPVVGFDTGCETELVTLVGHGRLAPNRDAGALAAAAASVLAMSDRGRAMGASGMDYCRAHLDIRRSIDAFTSVYAAWAKRQA